MSLKSLTIKNFQAHKNLKISFDKHVTTIIGPNDVGKTAVLRALRFVALNRPIGRQFITHGTDQTVITLKAEKRKIVRKIGKSSLYKLDKKVFKAFRSDVPSAIAKVLSVDEINFQQQHEPVFWFSLTPGQIAKELNKLVDLEAIDAVQSDIAKQLRDKSAELRVTKDRLASAARQRGVLKWVRLADGHLRRAESAKTDHATKSHRLTRIERLAEMALSADAEIVASSGAILGATAAITAGDRIMGLRERVSRLEAISGAVRGCQRALSAMIPPLPEPPSSNGWERLAGLVVHVKQLEDEACRVERVVAKKERQLEEALGGFCPMCGGILTGSSLV